MATTNDKVTPAQAQAKAKANTAPTMATLAAPPVALPCYPVHGGTTAAVAAVVLAAGQLATVPCNGGTATFAAPVAARYTAGRAPAAWPPLYTSGGGTTVAPPGGAPGAGAYHVVAWCTTAAGNYWGVVHVYHGHTANVASTPGTGAMVATAAPRGAVVVPATDAVLALAKDGAV